jgi:hypothetical protein
MISSAKETGKADFRAEIESRFGLQTATPRLRFGSLITGEQACRRVQGCRAGAFGTPFVRRPER